MQNEWQILSRKSLMKLFRATIFHFLFCFVPFHLIHERNSLFMSDIAIIHLYLTLRQVDEMTSWRNDEATKKEFFFSAAAASAPGVVEEVSSQKWRTNWSAADRCVRLHRFIIVIIFFIFLNLNSLMVWVSF